MSRPGLALWVALASLVAAPLHGAPPPDASAQLTFERDEGLAAASWSLSTWLHSDVARDIGADHDLIYEVLVTVPELISRWIGLGGLLALHHDLDGDVGEPLALVDVGTRPRSEREAARLRALLEALWLRVGPREGLHAVVGRQDAPALPGAPLRREPVLDGARAELALDGVRLSAFGGRWSETWALGGCAGCDAAWGLAGDVTWTGGRAALRVMDFAGVASELAAAHALPIADDAWLDLRGRLALHETRVRELELELGWRQRAPDTRATRWLALDGGHRDLAGVPDGLLGLHALPEALARALRAATAQVVSRASVHAGGRGAHGGWLEGELGARLVAEAGAGWPWRDALVVGVGGGAGSAQVRARVAGRLFAALETVDAPVAAALEGALEAQPLAGLSLSLLARTGVEVEPQAWLPARGVHGAQLLVAWQVAVWADAAVGLEARYAVSGPGRAPFEGIAAMHAVELRMSLGSASGTAALPAALGQGVHGPR